MHKTIKHLVRHSAKHNSRQHLYAEYPRINQIDEMMDEAILAGIREQKEVLHRTDDKYFALTGRHIHQDIKKYLARHNLAHHYITDARK